MAEDIGIQALAMCVKNAENVNFAGTAEDDTIAEINSTWAFLFLLIGISKTLNQQKFVKNYHKRNGIMIGRACSG